MLEAGKFFCSKFQKWGFLKFGAFGLWPSGRCQRVVQRKGAVFRVGFIVSCAVAAGGSALCASAF